MRVLNITSNCLSMIGNLHDDNNVIGKIRRIIRMSLAFQVD